MNKGLPDLMVDEFLYEPGPTDVDSASGNVLRSVLKYNISNYKIFNIPYNKCHGL